MVCAWRGRGRAVVIAKIAKIARPSPGDSDSRNRESMSLTRLHHLAFGRALHDNHNDAAKALDSSSPWNLPKKRFLGLQAKCLSNSTRRDATDLPHNEHAHAVATNDSGPVFSDARGWTRNVERRVRARHLPGAAILVGDGFLPPTAKFWRRQSRHGPVRDDPKRPAPTGEGRVSRKTTSTSSRRGSFPLVRPMRVIDRTQGSSPSLHVPSISQDSSADTLCPVPYLRPKTTTNCHYDTARRHPNPPARIRPVLWECLLVWRWFLAHRFWKDCFDI